MAESATPERAAPLVDRIGVVVVVNTDDRTCVEACIESLAQSDPGIRIVVVDNSGRGDDGELAVGAPATIAYRPSINDGFGAAANLGAADPLIADADHVILVNDDIVVDDGWLAPLVETLDSDPRIGAVQPKLVLADTDPALINSLGVSLDAAGAGTDVGYRTPEASHSDETTEIDAFTGGAVAFRRSFFDDLGGFDERLFLYYEDVDLAMRGAERGWSYRCVAASRVVHMKGATTGAMADERIRLQERNRLITAARFGSPGTIARALWLSVRRLRHEPRGAHARALVSGVGRFPRALLERVRAERVGVESVGAEQVRAERNHA